MEQDQLKIDVAQDGQIIADDLIRRYDLQKNDIFYISSGQAYSNFVGIVQRGTRILVSIPKHFKKKSDFENYSINQKKKYIRLIMDTINKSVLGLQNSEYDLRKDYISDFALDAYFRIYSYFTQYGLYREEHQEVCPKSGNRVSWKDTLNKSNKLIIKGKLLFSPLYYKKKKSDESFLTECMIFVLNYTKYFLGDFMTLPSISNIANRGVNLSILNNEYVICKLEEILSDTFKDINRQLIRNIIIFLRKLNSMKEKVPNFKFYNYENIWEIAVGKYINDHFKKFCKDKLLFSDNKINNTKKFKKTAFTKYNHVHKDWRLEPDHYYKDEENKVIYIFDSKYYTNINGLNHKQFVYHILISNKNPEYTIIDSLITPTDNESTTELYLKVTNTYLKIDDKPIKIYLTKLNMIKVLDCYTK